MIARGKTVWGSYNYILGDVMPIKNRLRDRLCAGPVIKKILSDNLLSDSGLIVLERDARTALSIPEGLLVRRSKVYGRTALDFIISGGEE